MQQSIHWRPEKIKSTFCYILKELTGWNEHEYFGKEYDRERTKYSWNERNVFELWVIRAS